MGNGPSIGCNSKYFTQTDLLKEKEKQNKAIAQKVHGEKNDFKK